MYMYMYMYMNNTQGEKVAEKENVSFGSRHPIFPGTRD